MIRPTLLPVLALLGCAHAAPPSPAVAPGPHPDAPPELRHLGRLAGTWTCEVERRRPDGTFAREPEPTTWTWFWILDGTALQDVYEGPDATGTNLRIFDPGAGIWHMVWWIRPQRDFTAFTATSSEEEVVMRGERPARPPIPPHAVKVTFHDFTADSFAWRYEAGPPNSDGPWQEQVRLSCERR